MSSPVQKVSANLSLVKLAVGCGVTSIVIILESAKHPPVISSNTRTKTVLLSSNVLEVVAVNVFIVDLACNTVPST